MIPTRTSTGLLLLLTNTSGKMGSFPDLHFFVSSESST